MILSKKRLVLQNKTSQLTYILSHKYASKCHALKSDETKCL